MEAAWVGGGADEYGLSWLESCGGGGRAIQAQGGREDGAVPLVKVSTLTSHFSQRPLVTFLHRLVLAHFRLASTLSHLRALVEYSLDAPTRPSTISNYASMLVRLSHSLITQVCSEMYFC